MRYARLCLLLAALLLTCSALADEASDITSQALIRNARGQEVAELTDRRPQTSLAKDGGKAHYTITLPEGLTCAHLYVEQASRPVRLRVEVQDAAGQWQKASASDHPFLHQYMKLDGLSRFRLTSDEAGRIAVLGELYLFGEGELPGFVQRWQMPEGKMDMMQIVAHPDDELLWFGGAIPYYAGVRGKKLLNVYMAPTGYRRQTEMLNGLWHAGQRLYPVLGPFRDVSSRTLKQGNEAWGQYRIERFIVDLLRQWQPDVVLTHAQNGEYGHGAHRATSAGAAAAVAKAAVDQHYKDSAQAYGTWQVKKLYRHLGGEEGRLQMDWTGPQDCFGGRSCIEVASEAFSRYLTQQRFQMPEDGSRLDNRIFQLVHSTVGEDEEKDDFFEHVPLPAAASR